MNIFRGYLNLSLNASRVYMMSKKSKSLIRIENGIDEYISRIS